MNIKDFKYFCGDESKFKDDIFVKYLSKLKSSYKKNNYWLDFYHTVLNLKPNLIVEIGILEGYSLLSLTKGCIENKKGKIVAIDLFEDYPYNHANYIDIINKLNNFGVSEHILLIKSNVLGVKFKNNTIDLLHIDISNTGDKIIKLLKKFHSKLNKNAVIIIEGGSTERDTIKWMIKNNCEPISNIFKNKKINELYSFFTVENYPSITYCFKK